MLTKYKRQILKKLVEIGRINHTPNYISKTTTEKLNTLFEKVKPSLPLHEEFDQDNITQYDINEYLQLLE